MNRRFSAFGIAHRLLAATLCCAVIFAAALAAEPTALDEATKAKLVRDRDEAARAALEAKGAGDYDKALERQLGRDPSDDFATTLGRIAGVHEAREDFAAAEKAWRDVLAVQTRLHGGEHWQVADARRAVANVQTLAALSAAQRKQLRKAKELNTAAVRLLRAGKFAEATAKAQAALAIRKQVLGEQHPDYATSLNNLAVLYGSQADYARAEPLLRQASETYKKALGGQHPLYAQSLNNLALLYDQQGDYSRAEPLYRQALQIAKKVFVKR